jgi:AraC family transcriptional regulator
MTALDLYRVRMQRVLEYVDAHLDDALDLGTLSRVAAFSKFHFHRQFKAYYGVSVHRYVQLARLQRASKQLAGPAGRSITEIALDAGYDAPDAFARVFRQRFGQSPSDFRKAPEWEPWLRAFRLLHAARSRTMDTVYTADQVTIREVENTGQSAISAQPLNAPSTSHPPARRLVRVGNRGQSAIFGSAHRKPRGSADFPRAWGGRIGRGGPGR